MDGRHSERMVLETTATCAVLAAGIAIAALLYQLITVVVPVLESMVFPRVAAASSQDVATEASTKTLAVLLAHADDESAVGPILARYAREGVQVHLIITTDGSQGAGSTGNLLRPDSGLRGDELARAAKRRGARRMPWVFGHRSCWAFPMENSATTSAIARCSTG